MLPSVFWYCYGPVQSFMKENRIQGRKPIIAMDTGDDHYPL